MSLSSPRVVAVRNGQVQPSGSWLYVWLDVQGGGIAYVGGTGFDPELRAYLHVSARASVGRPAFATATARFRRTNGDASTCSSTP